MRQHVGVGGRRHGRAGLLLRGRRDLFFGEGGFAGQHDFGCAFECGEAALEGVVEFGCGRYVDGAERRQFTRLGQALGQPFLRQLGFAGFGRQGLGLARLLAGSHIGGFAGEILLGNVEARAGILHSQSGLREFVLCGGFLAQEQALGDGEQVALFAEFVGGALGDEGIEPFERGLALALDVNAPAGELGGEAGVLPLLADGEAQLLVGHDHHGGLDLALFVEQHAGDARRAQRIGDVLGELRVPFDDVDLLAGQFVDDVLNAQSALAHATAHGVHIGDGGDDGGLAACAGFAGNGLDLDHAVAHFRNLLLHEAAEEIAVCAAELDDRAACALVHVDDEDLEIVAAAQFFGADLILFHHEDFVLVVEEQGDGARGHIHAAHLRGEDFAHLVCEILVDCVALGLANALQDDLFGGLRGDAAEVVGLGVDLDDVAQFDAGDEHGGFFLRDFGARIFDVFHNFTFGEDAHFARLAVNRGGDVGHRAVVALVG